MKTPRQLQRAAGADTQIQIREYDYGDESVIAADLDPLPGEPSLDVVDGTAIVVAGDSQFEFEIPAEADDVALDHGVLTITASERERD